VTKPFAEVQVQGRPGRPARRRDRSGTHGLVRGPRGRDQLIGRDDPAEEGLPARHLREPEQRYLADLLAHRAP
jgi:hypothetical protein